jgi:FMNH2-dependent dimethyl sulfone monooxygenase
LKFGFFLPTYGGWLKGQPKTDETSFEYVKKVALKAEEIGLSHLWIPDHLLNPMVGENEKSPESWVWLSALAALTNKIRVGHIVLCYAFRPPALTAKMAATLDEVSKGRFIFSIGACNYQREFEAYGYDWLENQKRIKALREFIIIVKKAWTSRKHFTFKGEFYSVFDCLVEPKPLQKPHPPIWVGGESFWIQEIAVEVGDCWLFYGDAPKNVEEKILKIEEKHGRKLEYAMNSRFEVGGSRENIAEKMRKLASQLGKPQVERIVRGAVIGSIRECVNRIEELKEAGLTHLILQSNQTLKDLEIFGREILPSFT